MLRKLFDEKIITIINSFLDNPQKKFSLTEISSSSKINISTTLRIINKLVRQGIIDVELTGKSKFYKLKPSEKTHTLNKILKKEDHIQEFIDRIKRDSRVKKIILEMKNERGAKLLIVGNFLSGEKIRSLAEEIRSKYSFRIQFVEISEKQFSEMQDIGLYNLDRKIIWERS